MNGILENVIINFMIIFGQLYLDQFLPWDADKNEKKTGVIFCEYHSFKLYY